MDKSSSVIPRQKSEAELKTWFENNIFQSNVPQFDKLRSRYLNRLGFTDVSAKSIEFSKNANENESPVKPKEEKSAIKTVSDPSTDFMSSGELPKLEGGDSGKKEKEMIETEDLKKIEEKANDLFSIKFLTKTDSEIREKYLNTLISKKILNLEPSKKHQSMIIFDWDDTLLSTTYLGSLGFVDLEQEILDQLKPLDESASKLLSHALTYGETYIITNAASGWVEYSSKAFLPKTNDVISQKKIEVISARSGYEGLYPGDSQKWKVEAFLDIKKKYNENIITNLICMGDSHIEIDAAHVLAKQFNQALIKTIKFRENPRPEELIKQQELVIDKLEQIYTSIRNLTIRLEKKTASQGKQVDK